MNRADVKKGVAQVLQNTWSPPAELPKKGVDQLLTKAWLAAGNLRLHTRRLERPYGDHVEELLQPLLDRRDELLDFILVTPALGLQGAQMKLRVLLDPQLGIEAGDGKLDIAALEHISAVIGREMVSQRERRRGA
jgi:hypothetical protein